MISVLFFKNQIIYFQNIFCYLIKLDKFLYLNININNKLILNIIMFTKILIKYSLRIDIIISHQFENTNKS